MIDARLSPATVQSVVYVELFIPVALNLTSPACGLPFTVKLEADKLPVIVAPVELVSNFLELLWYSSQAPLPKNLA